MVVRLMTYRTTAFATKRIPAAAGITRCADVVQAMNLPQIQSS